VLIAVFGAFKDLRTDFRSAHSFVVVVFAGFGSPKMKENTPPRKPGRRRTLGLAALNVTPRPDAEHKSQRELELELEVRGLKQKLAEYEKVSLIAKAK